MSKTKKEAIGRFELLHIISNQFTDDETKEIAQKIIKVIEDQEGKIIATEDWGKKRLCYQIKKFSFGYYNLVTFDIDRKNLITINGLLNQMREVLRFTITNHIKPYVIKVGMPEKFNRQNNLKSVGPITPEQRRSVPTPQPSTPEITTEKPETKPEVVAKTTTTKAEDKEETKTEVKTAKPKTEKTTEQKDTTKKEDEVNKNDADLDNKLDNILEAKDLF